MDIPRWLKQQKQLAGNSIRHAVALGVISSYLLIAQAWLLARVVSSVIFDDAGLHDVMPDLWMMLALMFVRAGLVYASEQVAFQAAIRVKLSLRDTLFGHLQKLAGTPWLDAQGSGELASSLMDGIEALENYYARYLPAMSLMALAPLSILVFVFPSDWVSGLVLVLTAPLIPFFMILIGRGAEKKNQQQWRQLARMSAHLLDMIQGLTTLKLFNASRREAQTIASISDEYRQRTMAVLRVAFLSSFALEFFSTISIAVVAVLVGFRLYWGELDFLYGFFVLLLAPEFYLPLRNMGTHYHARMEAIGAAEKIIEILNVKPVVHSSGEATTLLPESLDIELKKVSCQYEEEKFALQDVSMVLPANKRVAIVGHSGAGKSTLIKLILGFMSPTRGEILVGGKDFADIGLEDWRKQLAWVPQKPRLFHGSIADNIRLGNPDASLQQVTEAARLANASEFIDRLEHGYDTLVGDRGEGLSGGQIQRIALARAFLKNAPVVVLDEATAHLDSDNELLVQQAIARLGQNRLLIMVAHRLKTVRDVDIIYVLEQGRLVEQGSHDQLLASQGKYFGLLQASGALA